MSSTTIAAPPAATITTMIRTTTQNREVEPQALWRTEGGPITFRRLALSDGQPY